MAIIKNALIELIATYLQTEEFYSNLKLNLKSVRITIQEILSTGSRTIFQYNLGEDDTRLIFHSIVMKQDVVIVRKDRCTSVTCMGIRVL